MHYSLVSTGLVCRVFEAVAIRAECLLYSSELSPDDDVITRNYTIMLVAVLPGRLWVGAQISTAARHPAGAGLQTKEELHIFYYFS